MKLTIGFSPCPNDTFIFDALVNNKISNEEFEFEVVMEDVQTLNELALEGKLDIIKISYATLPLVLNDYIVLNTGGALGNGVGPLLISKIPIPEPAIKHCNIALPGQNTTANLLFSLAYPEATNKVFIRYDEIEEFVNDSVDSLENLKGIRLGVIIHENRFTYEQKGLVKLVDLGNLWEKETGFPIPLGGIVIRRSLGKDLHLQINKLIQDSIHAGYSRYPTLSNYVIENAREMDQSVMREHINLYVNDFSMDLGETGKEAVKKFLQIHSSINKIPIETDNIFVL